MEEMTYEPEMHDAKILYKGEFRGIDYLIVSYGTHPCCYVRIPLGNKYYNTDFDKIDIDCHGGVTYAQFHDFGFGKNYYIGWDYAHFNDYTGFQMLLSKINKITKIQYPDKLLGKKWTVFEMIKECQYVIRQIQF